MGILTVGGTQEDGTTLCTDICIFDKEEKKFIPFKDLRNIYKEVGNKMGFQATVVGEYDRLGNCQGNKPKIVLDI